MLRNWFMTLLVGSALMLGLSSCTDPEVETADCPNYGPYFDIQGLELSWAGTYVILEDGDTAVSTRLPNLKAKFITVNFAQRQILEKKWGIEDLFFPSAYAQPCPVPALRSGAKYERLADLNILTLIDFDANHLAGDTINEFFDIQITRQNHSLPAVPIPSFRNTLPAYIESDNFSLVIKKAPVLKDKIKVKVIVGLSTGEVNSAESPLLVVKN